MSDTASSAFLSGQGIPVELGKIETALSDLWGSAVEQQGGVEVETPAVTRVSLANLVVSDLGGVLSEETLDTVVARYPCRAVVIRRDDSVGRKVVAEISALCHLPAPGLPQVCSERISLRAGKDGIDLIPGAVRPLLEADLPVVLWSVGDPREALALFREMAAEANRVVLDLPDPSSDLEAVRAALDLTVNPFARDLAWFGATRWRELAAQFFDPSGQESYLNRMRSVAISVEATEAGSIPRVAAWLMGWLAGQLGWVPKRRVQSAPARHVMTFTAPSGDIDVTISTELDAQAAPARISSMSLTAAEDDGKAITFHLVRLEDQVVVEVDGPNCHRLPRMVRSPELTVPDRVSAALESAREDPPYRKALPNMIWVLGGGVSS